ncbi:MAG: hypothetical protein J5J00_12815 [Deltaproteobacteria bacterium]|nr:hypothetical protein [Deltaproteobacteria bacterium]
MSDTPHFTIKALAPDNDRVLKSLVTLFEGAHGLSHPNKNVYALQYWRSHIGSRFTSLGAFVDGKMAAHIALLPDPHDQLVVQLIFPVVSPAYKQFEEEIIDALDSVIAKQAARRSWNSIFYFDYVGCPSEATFELPIMGSREVAIAPAYFPMIDLSSVKEGNANGNGSRSCRLTIEVRQAILNKSNEERKILYVPERHASVVNFLYEPFALQREFRSVAESSTTGTVISNPFFADCPAVYEDYFSPIETIHLYVQPSLITAAQKLQLLRKDGDAKARYIFLNMQDPACIALCQEIESQGFSFCGVMPCFFGQENIIYFWAEDPSFDVEAVRSLRGSKLARHMEVEAKKRHAHGILSAIVHKRANYETISSS